jgi:hypothetical protein
MSSGSEDSAADASFWNSGYEAANPNPLAEDHVAHVFSHAFCLAGRQKAPWVGIAV